MYAHTHTHTCVQHTHTCLCMYTPACPQKHSMHTRWHTKTNTHTSVTECYDLLVHSWPATTAVMSWHSHWSWSETCLTLLTSTPSSTLAPPQTCECTFFVVAIWLTGGNHCSSCFPLESNFTQVYFAAIENSWWLALKTRNWLVNILAIVLTSDWIFFFSPSFSSGWYFEGFHAAAVIVLWRIDFACSHAICLCF